MQPQKDKLSQTCNFEVPDCKTVKLMSMDGQVPLVCIVPRILLINADADQMRHHFGQAMIMVPFHPDYFHIMFGVGQLADVSQKLPMLFGQPAEIQIGKHVAQQNQPTKMD